MVRPPLLRGTARRVRRRRHRSGSRGVSPIIATILLVAITVSLAAVLYIFLLRFAPTGTSNLPTYFAWGTSTPIAPGAGGPGCAAGDSCWEVTISVANGGAAPSSMYLYVQNASTGRTVSTSSWNFTFVNSNNQLVASAPGPSAGLSTAWTAYSPYSTTSALTLAMDLWIDFGEKSSTLPSGYALYAVGQSGWSGALAPLTLAA